jgi:S-adenosylmethionine-dependent methyltransferase
MTPCQAARQRVVGAAELHPSPMGSGTRCTFDFRPVARSPTAIASLRLSASGPPNSTIERADTQIHDFAQGRFDLGHQQVRHDVLRRSGHRVRDSAAAVTAMLESAAFTDVGFTDVREPLYYGPEPGAALDWVRGFTCTSETLRRLDPAAAARAVQSGVCARRSPRTPETTGSGSTPAPGSSRLVAAERPTHPARRCSTWHWPTPEPRERVGQCETPKVPDDAWAVLADPFVDEAYATVKGRVRTFVLHQQLLAHLPDPPATVLDVGGGGAHQSLPLARLGYQVTVLDSSAAMLAKAEQRVGTESTTVRNRVRLIEAPGESAAAATAGERFGAVLCHGVLMYLSRPEPIVRELCRCAAPGGVVSIMALNAATLAIRPALEQRWTDALAAFDASSESGVLGVDTRGDTVEHLSELLHNGHAPVEAWYGVWLFSDWLDLPLDTTDLGAVADVELEASRRDPYRQLSRVFHLVGRRAALETT